jgi:hypothetical protein
MRDWTGSRIQSNALTVPCLYCGAVEGELCVAKADGKPLVAFPAHTSRINESKRRNAEKGATA